MKEFVDYIAARKALANAFGLEPSDIDNDVSMYLECKWRIHEDYECMDFVEWDIIEDSEHTDDIDFEYSMDLVGNPHTSRCGRYILVGGFDGNSQSVIFSESNRLPNVK